MEICCLSYSSLVLDGFIHNLINMPGSVHVVPALTRLCVQLINSNVAALRDVLISDNIDNLVNCLLPLPAIWTLPGHDFG